MLYDSIYIHLINNIHENKKKKTISFSHVAVCGLGLFKRLFLIRFKNLKSEMILFAILLICTLEGKFQQNFYRLVLSANDERIIHDANFNNSKFLKQMSSSYIIYLKLT